MHALCNFTNYFLGQLNQTELSARIDSFLITPAGEIEHLHNQLIAAIYANVTREMPDQGVASWVSANDKPTTGAGSKPVSGDAAEQRLKTEVMHLPARDRRRIKDITQNDVCARYLLRSSEIHPFTGEQCANNRNLSLILSLRYPTSSRICEGQRPLELLMLFLQVLVDSIRQV
jgi:hypothetical protein